MKRFLLVCFCFAFVSCAFGQSITSNTSFTALKIFPQPADEQLTITAQNQIKKIEFFTVSGALVQSHFVDAKSYTISLFDFPSGIYIAKIFGTFGEEAVERISVH